MPLEDSPSKRLIGLVQGSAIFVLFGLLALVLVGFSLLFKGEDSSDITSSVRTEVIDSWKEQQAAAKLPVPVETVFADVAKQLNAKKAVKSKVPLPGVKVEQAHDPAESSLIE